MAAISPQNPPSDLLVVEDDMEISSDAGRMHDDGIEMDRDNHTEDEDMIEDVIHIAVEGRSTTHNNNDDVMLDSDDDGGIQQDEVLRDASVDLDEDIQINDLNDLQETNIQLDHKSVDHDLEIYPSEESHPQISVPEDAHFKDTRDFASVPTNVDSNILENTGQVQAFPNDHDGVSETDAADRNNKSETEEDPVQLARNDVSDEAVSVPPNAGSEGTEGQLEVTRTPLDDNTSKSLESTSGGEFVDDNETHPYDGEEFAKITLHPTIIMYEGSEIHLFPPTEQNDTNTFFLKDESIANQTIAHLLHACRGVLGDSIDKQDELEVGIAVLGLAISEGSIDCAEYSFLDIVQAYVQLCHNDGIDDPGPLYVTLNTKPKFAARLEALRISATEGKGLSEIEFLHLEDDLYDGIDPVVTETGHGSEFLDGSADDGQHNLDETAFNSIISTAKRETHSGTESLEADKSGHDENEDVIYEKRMESKQEFETSEQPFGSEAHVDYTSVDVQQGENNGSADTEHPEDDLLDFGDEDPALDEGHPSSGSSTVQGDATNATAASGWQFPTVTENAESPGDEADLNLTHEDPLSDLEGDELTQPEITEDAIEHTNLPESPTSSRELNASSDLDAAHSNDVKVDEDDIHFDDEDFAPEAETKDRGGANIASNEAHDIEDVEEAEEVDTKQNSWSEEKDTIDFEEEVTASGSSPMEQSQPPIDLVRSSISNNSKQKDETDVPAEDFIDYSDEETETLERLNDDAPVQDTNLTLSRKRSWSEGHEGSKIDETPQSSKKARPS